MPKTANATVHDWEGFEIKLRIDLVDGRYRCVDLHLVRSGPEITGASCWPARPARARALRCEGGPVARPMPPGVDAY